ncbi:Imm6 family immunity protein [Clostridium sp. SHJSY1]|uniref:Imm6 family immunity protein n=1 Tax=Clostridium sp. SHJSY1 TaxID=2942483 RepID=UPI002875F42B|nr:Imm6 family immunity protein [Clostridium sp. SHJSY1]MDS0525212.1 Imm6 family immunity protein [Clostridium sp. SHJSY1]
MMNINFGKFIDDYKVIYFLGLSEKIVPLLSERREHYVAMDVLDSCWKWVNHRKHSGEYFYKLLYHEDSGMTVIQEFFEDGKERSAWDCIIYAVAYTCRKAYEYDMETHFPEPIDSVDDSIIEGFMDCFNNCIENGEEYIKKLDVFLSENELDFKEEWRNEVLKRIK